MAVLGVVVALVFAYLDSCQKSNQLVTVLITEQVTGQSSEQAVVVANDREGDCVVAIVRVSLK